jgi:ABC-2 type transport system permease protein
MNQVAYTRFELIRLLRNARFFIFTLVFPLVLYFIIAAPQKNDHDLANTGISAPLYFMVSIASFGTMMGMVSSGARIAAERTAGWTRQLRVTPLSAAAYFRAKVLSAYLVACVTLLLLYVSGASLGVSLGAGKWIEMTALVLVALLPFAALGILLGHLLTSDSIGPATGGVVSLLSLVSGTWFPLTQGTFLYHLAQYLPSYWLVQAGRVSLGGSAWGAKGWTVVVVWTLVLARLARLAYRRDTGRV